MGRAILSIDEFDEKNRANFPSVDADGDGQVTLAELDVAIKAAGAATE